VANGLGTDQETPIGLKPDEHRRYQDALNASLIDEDPEPLFAWFRRQERELITYPDGSHVIVVGPGERTLRVYGDPDAQERYAVRQREWRAAHPGADKRKRGHRDRAAYMREYRARQKASVTPGAPALQAVGEE
jgi:hypothetical protein